ncbi:MAG: hypothetical protein H7062_02500, partial [Candidatus Saccharimonas sp.]|nr:hypothetical protein [Planctomycetaceae bacterium]
LALVGLGCGGGGVKYKSVSVQKVDLPVTKVLQSVATSGELGSGMMEVESALEQLKKSDPAKAAILEAGLPALRAAEGNPDKMKQVAGELATKLGG